MYLDDKNVTKKSVTKGGVTKEVAVTKAENGYIICITITDTNNDKYETKQKHYISKENPLEKMLKEEGEDYIETSSEMVKAISNII